MKCKNCGADIPAEAIRCAYCDTVNPGGVSFLQRLKEKREENKRLRKELLRNSREAYLNQLLNRAMIIFGVLMIVVVFVSTGVTIYAQGYRTTADPNKDAIMQKLYDEEAYQQLDTYMSTHDLIGNDHYSYTRVALINNSYEKFFELRNDCIDIIRKQDVPDDELIRAVIEKGVAALYADIPAYPDVCPEEKQLTDKYNVIVTDFLTGVFGFGDQELDYIRENVHGGRLYGDEYIELVDIAKSYMQKGGEPQ